MSYLLVDNRFACLKVHVGLFPRRLMPKYLFTFEKGESVRWLGHLDILRTFERAIRRAGLPIAFSNGFNPRERLVFASALSTGVTGAAEPALLELTEAREPSEIVERLNGALPDGIRLNACEQVANDAAKERIAGFDRGEYRVVCGCSESTEPGDLEEAIAWVLARAEIPITRQREGRTRVVDIRPLIHELSLAPENLPSLPPGRTALRLVIALTDAGTGRPGEIVDTLACRVPGLTLRRAHRVRLIAPDREPGRQFAFTAA